MDDCLDRSRSALTLGLVRRTTPGHYRGTSLIRNCFLLGPYSRPMPRALVLGGLKFLMSEVPL